MEKERGCVCWAGEERGMRAHQRRGERGSEVKGGCGGQVKQLRPAERGYVDHIKGACETKRKTYRSLVWTAQVPRCVSLQMLRGGGLDAVVEEVWRVGSAEGGVVRL